MAYMSVDVIVAEVSKAGQRNSTRQDGHKTGIQNIPVYPHDRLLGMHWRGEVLVNMALPFGLQLAPLIFTAVAYTLQWAWQHAVTTDAEMLWAAASLCFFGFRSGELTVPSEAGYDASTHLSFGDRSVDSFVNPQLLQVHLKALKTDPF